MDKPPLINSEHVYTIFSVKHKFGYFLRTSLFRLLEIGDEIIMIKIILISARVPLPQFF
jgi:hypothetical protein